MIIKIMITFNQLGNIYVLQHLNQLFPHSTKGSLRHQLGGSRQLAHQGQQGKHPEHHEFGPHIIL